MGWEMSARRLTLAEPFENHDEALEHDEVVDPVSVAAVAALEAILATAS
jgi:hypothetical protein